MRSSRSARDRALARARAWRAGLAAGVRVSEGVRFGPGVIVSAAPGGTIYIGPGVEIGAGSQLWAGPGATLRVESDVFISSGCILAARQHVEVGADSMIAELVAIRDHDHDPDSPPRSGRMLITPVHVGARVWLALKSSVIRGGGTGDDVVVGAHCLVNSFVPSNSIVGGVPARILRRK